MGQRRTHADNAAWAQMGDSANAPRCELMSRPDGGRCRSQGAGYWGSSFGAVALCDADRAYLAEQLRGFEDEWEWLDVDRERVVERLERMAAGYFG